LGSALGGRIANPEGGRYLLAGGMGAAESLNRANSYNPFAEALTSASRNPALTNAASRFFSSGGGGGSSTGFGNSDPYANVRTSSFT
jgi:hypothetical protein